MAIHNACLLALLGKRKMSTTAGRAGHNIKELDTQITKKSFKHPLQSQRQLGVYPPLPPCSPTISQLFSTLLMQQRHMDAFTVAGTYVLVGICCSSAWTKAEYIVHTYTSSVIRYEKHLLSSSSAVRTIKYSRYDMPHTQRSPW